MHTPHGIARLSDDGKTLTITTKAKRGKKLVDNVQTYEVSDAQPDPRVAFPVIAIKKTTGDVYHVGRSRYGWFCDCPNGQVREKYNSPTPCKHYRACAAVGLIQEYDDAQAQMP